VRSRLRNANGIMSNDSYSSITTEKMLSDADWSWRDVNESPSSVSLICRNVLVVSINVNERSISGLNELQRGWRRMSSRGYERLRKRFPEMPKFDLGSMLISGLMEVEIQFPDLAM
jgi:hypothetical protein